MKKLIPTIVLTVLLALTNACSRVPEFGVALSTLEEHAKETTQECEQQKADADEAIQEAAEKPHDRTARETVVEKYDHLIKAHDNQIQTIQEDLEVVIASGNVTLNRIAARIAEIRDPAIKESEMVKLQQAKVRFNRQVVTVRNELSQCRDSMQLTNDALIVVRNASDLAAMKSQFGNLSELRSRSATLLASVRELTVGNASLGQTS